MTPSQACIDLVKEFEGCRLTAYRDVAGVLTIGWGHVDAHIFEGMIWTQAQADNDLDDDIGCAGDYVEEFVKVPLKQGQFDALTDFVFNLGAERLAQSTLLSILNAGNYAAIPGQLFHLDAEGNPHGWIYAGGVVQPGLIRRRQAEVKLWNS